jgi:hypothetical protein
LIKKLAKIVCGKKGSKGGYEYVTVTTESGLNIPGDVFQIGKINAKPYHGVENLAFGVSRKDIFSLRG